MIRVGIKVSVSRRVRQSLAPKEPSRLLPFVSSPKRLSSNRLTRTFHDSLLQEHILPSLGPRHPRSAPLVLQVLVSQQPCHVIDWV